MSTVDLSHNELASVPESVLNDISITSLNLSHNNLVTLPRAIGNLTNLTSLNLTGNLLFSLPPQLGYLPSLTRIFVDDNPLEEQVVQANAAGELLEYVKLGEPLQHRLAEWFAVFAVAAHADCRLAVGRSDDDEAREMARVMVELPNELRFAVLFNMISPRVIRGSYAERPKFLTANRFPSEACAAAYIDKATEAMNARGVREVNEYALRTISVRVVEAVYGPLESQDRAAATAHILSVRSKLDKVHLQGLLPNYICQAERDRMTEELVAAVKASANATAIRPKGGGVVGSSGGGGGPAVEPSLTVAYIESQPDNNGKDETVDSLVFDGEKAIVRLLKSRRKKGCLEYKVKWNDGSPSTWEDIADLRLDYGLDLLDHIQAFDERNDPALKSRRISQKNKEEAALQAAAESREEKKKAKEDAIAAEREAQLEEERAAERKAAKAAAKERKRKENEQKRQQYGSKKKPVDPNAKNPKQKKKKSKGM